MYRQKITAALLCSLCIQIVQLSTGPFCGHSLTAVVIAERTACPVAGDTAADRSGHQTGH